MIQAKNPHAAFISIASLDSDIDTLTHHLESIHQKIKILHDKREIFEQCLKELKQQYFEQKKSVDMLELRIKELDGAIADRRNKMLLIQGSKEYTHIKQEIDQLKKEQYEIEQLLLSAWTELDSCTYKIEAQKKDIEVYHTSCAAEFASLEQARVECMQKRDALYAQKKEYERCVPEEWRVDYERMSKAVADPIVSIDCGSCSVCGTLIPEQMLIRLRKSALLRCPGCFRFIYDTTTTS